MKVPVTIILFYLISISLTADFKQRALEKKNLYSHLKRVEGDWIIKFFPYTPNDVIEKVVSRVENDGVLIRLWKKSDGYGHMLILSGISEDACDLLINDFFDYIEYAEPNVKIELGPGIYKKKREDTVSWGLDRIDQRNLPLDFKFNYDNKGSDVTVYVLDTGVQDKHIEFKGRAENVFSAYIGINWDDNGHGTHVAGIIGSETYGVAKEVKIKSLKVLDYNGDGTLDSVISGLNYVINNKVKPSIINMSLGAGSKIKSIEDLVKELRDMGILSIIAAGNDGEEACQKILTSNEYALYVGATDINDKVATFSNYGSCVDIYAPGDSIDSLGHLNDNHIAQMSGTSMSTPYVTGVAALLLQKKPNLTPDELESLIIRTSTYINGIEGRMLFYGNNNNILVKSGDSNLNYLYREADCYFADDDNILKYKCYKEGDKVYYGVAETNECKVLEDGDYNYESDLCTDNTCECVSIGDKEIIVDVFDQDGCEKLAYTLLLSENECYEVGDLAIRLKKAKKGYKVLFSLSCDDDSTHQEIIEFDECFENIRINKIMTFSSDDGDDDGDNNDGDNNDGGDDDKTSSNANKLYMSSFIGIFAIMIIALF